MEKFNEFLDNIKKVEIEDEEFKKELKKKLYSIYDKRNALKKRSFALRSLSYAVIILIIIIPIFFVLNKTFINKPKQENLFLEKTLTRAYDEKLLKILENDEIIQEKLEEENLIKYYKSGVKIYEKDGLFQKITFGEEKLKEYKVDLNDVRNLIISIDQENLKFDSIYISNILQIFKNDNRFDFIEKDMIKNLIKYNDNLILSLVYLENGDWLFLIDLKINKIVYFEYPF